MSWLLLIASGILEIFVVKSIRDLIHKKYRTAIPLYIGSLAASLFLLHIVILFEKKNAIWSKNRYTKISEKIKI